MVPKIEPEKRIKEFQKILREKEIDGALLVQLADTLYFTGTAQNVHLYLPKEGAPLVLARKDAERAARECPFEVTPLTGISKLPRHIADANLREPKVLGLEYDVLPVTFFQRYQKTFPQAKFIDISPSLRWLRAVKSDWEIAQIEKACAIYAQLLKDVQAVLRPGISEMELDGWLEMKARLLGHEPFARLRSFGGRLHFSGIVAGDRAAVPTYFDGPIGGPGGSVTNPIGSSFASIQKNESVVMDIAVIINGYHSDITRILVCGELPEKFQKAFDLSLALEEQLRQMLVPGNTAGEIYEKALNWVRRETPFAANFMGFGSSQVRFVGHGIGIELDEFPVICQGAESVLTPGMVVALEPKFVFPGEGAIGIEDSFAVAGSGGARCLSTAPKEVVRIL